MTLRRTNESINKAEDDGMTHGKSGSSMHALQRVFPTAVAKVSQMSWLDSPRDLIQRNIGNI